MAVVPAEPAGPQRGPRTQYWVFTITNLEGPPTDELPEDPDLYRNFRLAEDTIEELELYRYQPEVGAGDGDLLNGLLHIQGMCKTRRKGLRYTQLNAIFHLQPYQVHWEPARDFAAAWDYVGKEETRLIGGICHCGGSENGVSEAAGILEELMRRQEARIAFARYSLFASRHYQAHVRSYE
jgi:hypothetical protein